MMVSATTLLPTEEKKEEEDKEVKEKEEDIQQLAKSALDVAISARLDEKAYEKYNDGMNDRTYAILGTIPPHIIKRTMVLNLKSTIDDHHDHDTKQQQQQQQFKHFKWLIRGNDLIAIFISLLPSGERGGAKSIIVYTHRKETTTTATTTPTKKKVEHTKNDVV